MLESKVEQSRAYTLPLAPLADVKVQHAHRCNLIDAPVGSSMKQFFFPELNNSKCRAAVGSNEKKVIWVVLQALGRCNDGTQTLCDRTHLSHLIDDGGNLLVAS